MKLSKEEYLRVQSMIVLARKLLEEVPLAAFLEDLEHAESTTPFFDPTLWIEGHHELAKVKKLAQAARALQGCELPLYATKPPVAAE